MQHDYQQYRDQLRDTVASGEDTHILQTVNDEQSEYCRREHFPKILYILRRLPSLPGR